MRVERAIDAFLDWRRLERDATPRSIDSYRRILWKLAEDYPEIELRELTTADLRAFLNRWADRSASTRSNVISVIHSFFDWANVEDIIDVDPSTKIRRPKKRRPDIYRPSIEELERIRGAALPHELPAILLMEGAGLRNSEVLACRWADLDLVRGRARVFRKGQNWHWLPLDPEVVEELRASFRNLQPELDDHVFTVELEQWVSQYERKRRRKNPKRQASGQALWRMVSRVCKGPACARFRLINSDTASPTASCARAAATLAHSVILWVTPESTRRSCTRMRSNSTSSQPRSNVRLQTGTHKRRQIRRRLRQSSSMSSKG
jgi:integrase